MREEKREEKRRKRQLSGLHGEGWSSDPAGEDEGGGEVEEQEIVQGPGGGEEDGGGEADGGDHGEVTSDLVV